MIGFTWRILYNQAVVALAKNPVSHFQAKHIDLHHHLVRKAIQDRIIRVRYISTVEMMADSLTKPLGLEKCTTRIEM